MGDNTDHSARSSVRLSATSDTIEELRVLFADRALLRLQVAGGLLTATAEEIMSFVITELSLGEEARHLFALWVMSPSLELQLKPTHIIYQVLNNWSSLLEKYGEYTEDDAYDSYLLGPEGMCDEVPIIIFRRNVFYPIEKEKILVCRSDFPATARYLLYAEAAQNLLCGRVISGDPLKYHELAGLRATIEYGQFDENKFSYHFYDKRLGVLYPEHLINWKSSLTGHSLLKYFTVGPCAASLRKNFVNDARSAHREVGEGPYGSLTELECQQRYIALCSELPVYSSAFFPARLRVLGRLWGYNDIPVTVAINTYGVCVFNQSDTSLMTALSYRCLSAIYDETIDTQSLHLKFSTRQRNQTSSSASRSADGKSQSHVIVWDVHLVSKQAVFMHALILTFTSISEAKAQRTTPPKLSATKTRKGADTPLLQSRRREERFWTNKYKTLRLPSFQKDV